MGRRDSSRDNKKEKIEFQYFDYNERHKKVYRKDGAKYVMNPYATVFSGDNYYLLCYNDKYRTIMHYRVDRMDNVKMIEDDILPLEDEKKFDVTKHKKEVFGMFMGQEEQVTFDVHKSLLDVIYDKFGADIHLVREIMKHIDLPPPCKLVPYLWGGVARSEKK